MNNTREHSEQKARQTRAGRSYRGPNKIGASTPYDFEGKNLTAYGGLLPVATMLEKLGFQQLVEETLTVKRITRAMPHVSVRAGHGVGGVRRLFAPESFAFLEREPMLTGILKVLRLPPQCTFWRFLASLQLILASTYIGTGAGAASAMVFPDGVPTSSASRACTSGRLRRL